MPLVQPPVLDHGQPEKPSLFQCQIERFDRARLHRGEAARWNDTLFAHQSAGSFCLGNALFRQINVPPTGETVLQIPLALAVANKNEFGNWLSPNSYLDVR